MAKTSIEWTDHSINPFRARDREGHVGHYCEKISAGCTHCYASGLQKRFQMPEYRADKREGIEVFLDESKLQEVLRRRVPTKYFWNDMTDMFLDCYPDDWIDKCFAVMALTPQHTHQVLTKRPRRMLRYLRGLEADLTERLEEAAHRLELSEETVGFIANYVNGWSGYAEIKDGNPLNGTVRRWPLPNIWPGVSVEDQKTADERVPLLLQTPAAVRWVSYEPALAGIDFLNMGPTEALPNGFKFIDALRGWSSDRATNAVPAKGYHISIGLFAVANPALARVRCIRFGCAVFAINALPQTCHSSLSSGARGFR